MQSTTEEDIICRIARRQRYLDQEQRRIGDWLRALADRGRRREKEKEKVEERRRCDYEKVEGKGSRREKKREKEGIRRVRFSP